MPFDFEKSHAFFKSNSRSLNQIMESFPLIFLYS